MPAVPLPKPTRYSSSRLVFLTTLAVTAGWAQEINLYTEFQRFTPYGEVVAQDREPRPREIISPAVARNGHLTIMAVVTAQPGTTYFVYSAVNPPDALELKVYRAYFVRCGNDYCPDWLVEQKMPSFGAMPELASLWPGQTTRCYVLDIWVPPGTPPRRVRVEALLKQGIWLVAPMEVRVEAPFVPDMDMDKVRRGTEVADLRAPASDTARLQLLRYVNGLPPVLPYGVTRLRDLIQRNAAEDMAVASSMGFRPPEFNWMSWTPFVYPQFGSEWYLRVRDSILRYHP